jgi:hypothetical protein
MAKKGKVDILNRNGEREKKKVVFVKIPWTESRILEAASTVSEKTHQKK